MGQSLVTSRPCPFFQVRVTTCLSDETKMLGDVLQEAGETESPGFGTPLEAVIVARLLLLEFAE
jgi:hypothetical protein